MMRFTVARQPSGKSVPQREESTPHGCTVNSRRLARKWKLENWKQAPVGWLGVTPYQTWGTRGNTLYKFEASKVDPSQNQQILSRTRQKIWIGKLVTNWSKTTPICGKGCLGSLPQVNGTDPTNISKPVHSWKQVFWNFLIASSFETAYGYFTQFICTG